MSLPGLPIHTSQRSTIARANEAHTMNSEKLNEDTVNTMLDANSQPGTTGFGGAGSEGDFGRVSVMAMAKLFEQLLLKKREAGAEPIRSAAPPSLPCDLHFKRLLQSTAKNAKRFCQRPGCGSLNPALIERFEQPKRCLKKVAPVAEIAKLQTMQECHDASLCFPASVPEMQPEQRRNEPELHQESCMLSHATANPSQNADCDDLPFHDTPMSLAADISNFRLQDDSPELCASSGSVQVKRKVSEMNREDAYGTTTHPCQSSLTERCGSTCGVPNLTRQRGTLETEQASASPASYLLGSRPPPKPQRLFLYPYDARAGGGDGENLSKPAVNACDGFGSKTPTNLTVDGASSSNPFDYRNDNSKNVSVEPGAASSSKRRVSSRFARWLRRKVFFRSQMKAAQQELDHTYVNFDQEINVEAIPVLLPQQDDKGVSPILSSSQEAVNETRLMRLGIADSGLVKNSYIDVKSVNLSSDEEDSKSM